MAASALVTTRIDPQIKEEASAVLEAIGMTVSDVMRLVLTRIAREGALPFEPLIPTTESVRKVRELRQARKPVAVAEPSAPISGIPETSPDRYLSGIAALNLPSESGTGDWHLIETFFKPQKRRPKLFVAGKGCPDNTNEFLGERGIFECSALLDKLKIPRHPGPAYAATHARAIADLVLASILSGGALDHIPLDDWMPQDRDKQQVFDLLHLALIHLSEAQRDKILKWQAKNST
jgi:addiction module RelB/DinJ family antitoxin